MFDFFKTPLRIGSLILPNRLIQGPLAGFSCAPFRRMYIPFQSPAYCVSEMISATDILNKHQLNSRYLYRAPEEKILCYQIAGHDPVIMARAALKLQDLGADLIDVNCGCPKLKIRKKGAGSALLDDIEHLVRLISTIKKTIEIPLTIKIRIQNNENDWLLVKAIESAGADALIVHGRSWMQDYDIACNQVQIAYIKKILSIPVIANGDIADQNTLKQMMKKTACDGYMISRAGTGRPWLYQELLDNIPENFVITPALRINAFIQHLHALTNLETEYKAVLQSKTLIRYYFRNCFQSEDFMTFYQLNNLKSIENYLKNYSYKNLIK